MAISIMNNSTALGAMGNLNKANSSLSKTISQLSSGLRINSAADDASGLAVSEKLRGQISGLSKAASNAQDGISMLQTAEGAMGSMTSIVQRMRELAVQAGDPAYTTNDRAMLQLEVDQLKEEINRVSATTEFNTKKLLNGDAAALWSSSSSDIEAIINGSVAEGNYKLVSRIDPGTNAVYKSNIMSIKEGAYSYDMTANATAASRFDNIKGMYSSSANLSVIMKTGTGVETATLDGGFIGSSNAAITGGSRVSGANTQAFTIEIEITSDKTATDSGTARFRVRNAATGALSDWKSATIDDTGALKAVNSADLTTNIAGVGGKIFAASAGLTLNDVAMNNGDRVLLSFGAHSSAITATGGFASVQVGTGGASVIFTAKSTLINANSEKTTTIYTAQMDEAGNVYYGSMDMTMAKTTSASFSYSAAATGLSAVLTILGAGDTASKYTKLSDIAKFTNADGRNVLANTQELTIYGNGKQAKITLEGNDTIKGLEDKLTAALVEQLGMGADTENANAADVNKNLINFVETQTGNSNEAVTGTFIVQSALLGSNSNLSFVGDQGVIDALGLSNIQAAKDSNLTVDVTDAHSGAFIGSDTVSDGVLRGVIKGADVIVNPSSAADVSYNATTKRMEFTAKAAGDTTYLHLKDNATNAAIGANEGQTLDISIGRMDTKSLNIDDVNVVTFDNAQSSITKLDQALEKISASRAKVGAQMNRLDYTINNLNNARENLTASESRIRDLDIAQASSDLAARQVLMQSATAMLAQANQLPSYAAQLLR